MSEVEENEGDPTGEKKAKELKEEGRLIRASSLRWEELTSREKAAFIDMVDQDFLSVEAARALRFDVAGTIRVAITPDRDEKGKPIVHIASPSIDIGKDIIGRMGEEEFTVKNISTGRFVLEDLQDRKLLTSKPASDSDLEISKEELREYGNKKIEKIIAGLEELHGISEEKKAEIRKYSQEKLEELIANMHGSVEESKSADSSGESRTKEVS